MALEKTRNDIIEQSLRMIGVIAEGESPTASQIQDSAVRLDWMVKSWQATGAHLWSVGEATVILQKGQESYLTGDTSTDHITEDYTKTALAGALIATDTVITLDDSTGLAVNDYIGIQLDTGFLHWTTIASLGPITITDAMPSAAAEDNIVYFYTTKIGKALRIPSARRETNLIDTQIIQVGRDDYNNLPDKSTQGMPVQYFYDPKISTGILYVWPTVQAVDTVLNITYYQTLDVFASSASNADFPAEWIEALAYNLAVRMAPDFGQGLPPEVAAIAAQSYQNALDWDQEDASVIFQYGRR